GSHLDTVRDAGRFDGALGVLLPIAAVEVLRGRGVKLPFAVEVVGFSEEEGVRFSSAYIGSRGFAGRLRRADLRLRDAGGVSLGQVLSGSRRGRFPLPRPAHSPSELIGYLEVHIEQGPVLESKGLGAGVVSSIAGQTRATITFAGRAGHAGTTPMPLRADALAGAAEFIVAAERLARSRPPLVATVGRVSAHPGASNVIAGAAELSLDVRHPGDSGRRAALRALLGTGRAIAARRGLSFSAKVTQDNGAVACSGELTSILAGSVRKRQGRSVALASGAGHDAVVLSRLAPVAMLFVRCREGRSHHPDEFVSRRDIAGALGIVVDFLGRMASRR
ncbi:MAG TPA: hydantoinase/carbamoylase family amidase, partial [Opitutaceae bacterium]|nr:hydantoinase/carbamoylase family amidase [Opitutaceae bacterium]